MPDSEILHEAYERLHRTGPEWGDQLTNHGPMAVEVLVRRGHEADVHEWVDAYVRRLDELPSPSDRITDETWRDALGDGRRIGDWTAYLGHEVTERPWRDVLATWWSRLLPGIAAGATHGVIRTSHAVRALLAGDENPTALTELAHGLAFWAARAQSVPTDTVPSGDLDAAEALDGVPRIPDQHGTVATRFGQLAGISTWPGAIAAMRAPADPDDARARLTELVDAATVRYLDHGHGSPVLLVHTATAPNAVLHTLPALPRPLWAPSLSAAWAASAAITAAYAPMVPASARSATARGPVPAEPGAVVDFLDRAVGHGDEHVIKFCDTAAEVYVRTGSPTALAAGDRVGELIAPAR